MRNVDPDVSADCHATGSVNIAAYALNEMREIALCAHHVGTHRAKLTDEGWTIVPMRAHHKGAGVGTESTGVHYALEG